MNNSKEFAFSFRSRLSWQKDCSDKNGTVTFQIFMRSEYFSWKRGLYSHKSNLTYYDGGKNITFFSRIEQIKSFCQFLFTANVVQNRGASMKHDWSTLNISVVWTKAVVKSIVAELITILNSAILIYLFQLRRKKYMMSPEQGIQLFLLWPYWQILIHRLDILWSWQMLQPV